MEDDDGSTSETVSMGALTRDAETLMERPLVSAAMLMDRVLLSVAK